MSSYTGKVLTSVALAGALVFAGLASGCTVRGTSAGGLVYYEPPPPRTTYVETRSGHVWVEGRWVWDDYGGEWVWYEGYWIRDNPGFYYVAGRWDRRGSSHVWVEPRWVNRSNARATVRVHDQGRPTSTKVKVNTKVKVKTSSGKHAPSRPGPRPRH